MRLRTSPLVESTAAVAVAILLLLTWDLTAGPAGFSVANAMPYQVLLFIIPSFTLTTLLGFLIRNFTRWRRFGLHSALNALMTTVIYLWFSVLLQGQTSGASQSVIQFWQASPLVAGLSFQVGLVITYWLMLGEGKKLPKTQYETNPTVASKKRKKK